jgi:hypothetical protein
MLPDSPFRSKGCTGLRHTVQSVVRSAVDLSSCSAKAACGTWRLWRPSDPCTRCRKGGSCASNTELNGNCLNRVATLVTFATAFRLASCKQSAVSHWPHGTSCWNQTAHMLCICVDR